MISTSKRLVAIAALLVATASPGSAVIITFLGQEIPIPTTFAGVSVDLETGAVSNSLGGIPGADANFVFGGEGLSNDADELAPTPSWQPVRSGTGNTDPVENLTVGTIVGPGAVTANDFGGSGLATSHFPPFANGSSGYLGFTLETSDSTTAYGWMRVTLQNDNTPGVIHGWAYQDNGQPIPVGVIPEPSQALLTCLGLAGLALRRRR